MPSADESSNRSRPAPETDTRATFDRAVTLHRDGDRVAALALYDRYLQANPTDAEALFLAATAHFQNGAAKAAEPLFRRAAEIAPEMEQIHNNHGLVLAALGRNREAVVAYRQALELDPQFGEAFNNLGSSLVHLGCYGEAIDAFRQAVRVAPDLAVAHNNLGTALKDEGDYEAAVACFRRAISADPQYCDAHSNLCSSLLERCDGTAALAACDAHFAATPGRAVALAFKTVALRQLDRAEEAEAIIDFDRLFRQEIQTEAPGFESIAEFNQVLSEHVLTHISMTGNRVDLATRLAGHTGHMEVVSGGPIAALETIIRLAVKRYMAAIAETPGHPFNAPKGLAAGDLSMWGVILEKGGHKIPHIHPLSWLSGVYYPLIPDSIGETPDGKAGWIGFGRVSEMYPLPEPAKERWLKPLEGLMVLMPSYVFHETAPLTGDATRISIAFDLAYPTD